jgi:hypothetical protein
MKVFFTGQMWNVNVLNSEMKLNDYICQIILA